MTIGASASIANDALTGSALVMAVLIGLHNIPEGMAISVPLISGGMSKMKADFFNCPFWFSYSSWRLYWLCDW